MGIFEKSPATLRKHARSLGGHPDRWMPTYVDMGLLDSGGDVRMNHTFAIVSREDLLFYECDPALYSRPTLADPFDWAIDFNGRIAITAIAGIRCGPVNAEQVSTSRATSIGTDLLWNKTFGRITRTGLKTVVMAAVVVIEMNSARPGKSPRLVFGVPHQGDAGDSSSGILGEVVPETIQTAMAAGSLLMEFSNAATPDAGAPANARAVALGLIELCNLSGMSVGALEGPFDGRTKALQMGLS